MTAVEAVRLAGKRSGRTTWVTSRPKVLLPSSTFFVPLMRGPAY